MDIVLQPHLIFKLPSLLVVVVIATPVGKHHLYETKRNVQKDFCNVKTKDPIRHTARLCVYKVVYLHQPVPNDGNVGKAY